ncbi:MAG: TetR/AcrR family transcriptional regulator [Spirochaetes bacterium]|jgi:AcrR family transcriptional regulator|nr:TetR/AcrR family transcriptional regulator [Spirochaetota bacterium]
MEKDSKKTREKILNATKKLLAEDGFISFGINSIARTAGVDKVLIYRYFGGLNELMNELFRQSDFWPDLDDLLGDNKPFLQEMSAREISKVILKGRLRELRKRPVTMEIMRWEMIQKNELTDELAREREKQGRMLLELLPKNLEFPEGMDISPAAALIVAGITHLVLRSGKIREFQGVDLESESGWSRIESAIDVLVDAYFSYYEKKKTE